MRMRPQNAPHIRLAQLMDIYLQDTASFSQLMAAGTIEEMRQCLSASTRGYWLTHYHFGAATEPVSKRLRPETINLLLINALAPLLFAYGRYRLNEKLCERAFNLLEQLPPESNHVVKAWHEGGLKAQNAADSQALLQLQQAYCQPRTACAAGSAMNICDIRNPENKSHYIYKLWQPTMILNCA